MLPHTEFHYLPLVSVKYLRISTFCSIILMSQTSGSGIVGHPSSLGYTRAGAFAGSFVRTDSAKLCHLTERRIKLSITMMSLDPIVPNFTDFSTFLSCQEFPAVLCRVAVNILAGITQKVTARTRIHMGLLLDPPKQRAHTFSRRFGAASL
jgi:hypothetical protein